MSTRALEGQVRRLDAGRLSLRSGVAAAAIVALTLVVMALPRGAGRWRSSDDATAGGRPAMRRAIIAEGEAALGCAEELRVLARSHAATTARALRLDPLRALSCGSDGACLSRFAMAAIDEGAKQIQGRLRMLHARVASDLALDLLMNRTHYSALQMCTDRDVAATLASMSQRGRGSPARARGAIP
jgi:hypothetical protein